LLWMVAIVALCAPLATRVYWRTFRG